MTGEVSRAAAEMLVRLGVPLWFGRVHTPRDERFLVADTREEAEALARRLVRVEGP